MATDSSSTLVRRSAKRSSHENDFTDWGNTIPFQSEGFQDLLRIPSGQRPTQLPSDRPAKRYRASVDDAGKQKIALKALPDYSNTRQVIALYGQMFGRLRQTDCRGIGQVWVGLIDPNKQYKHPYNGREKTKPNWWPDGVPHASPHHLGTDDQVTLLVHILRMSGKGKTTIDKLQKVAAHKIPVEKQEILDEIIAIRRGEEEVEKRRDHDGIKATEATDEELNQELIQVSGSASDGGRGRSPAGSPEDQTKETSLTSPLVESSRNFTPTTYASTSEALADEIWNRGSQYQMPYPMAQSISCRAPFSITNDHSTAAHMHEWQLGLGRLSWPYPNNRSSEHTMHCHQSMQPIQIACHSCHSCHSCHWFLMAQYNSSDLVHSTAQSLSSSQQTPPSNPASYSYTTSYGFPHQSWLIENDNDANNWNTSQYWNH